MAIPTYAAVVLAVLLAAGCATGPACDVPPSFAFDPKQCGGNPWDPAGGQTGPNDELAAVRAHYAGKGVTLGLLERAEVRDAVPAVCGAPRTDRLYTTLDAGDGRILLADGWFEESFPADDVGCAV